MAQWRARSVLLLILISAAPALAQTSPADGPWFGQIQCQLDFQQQGYERHEIQTWKLTSSMPVGKNGGMQLYSASWTVTGQGGYQRAIGQRPSLAQWSINVPPTAASVAMFVRASDGQFIIRIWQRPVPSNTGINAMRQIADNGVAQQPARINSTVQEWMLPWIPTNPAGNLSGKLSVPVESLGADLTPSGLSPMANCAWQFSRTANTIADEQNATNARIVNDYTTAVQQSWANNQKYIGAAPAGAPQSAGAGAAAAAGGASAASSMPSPTGAATPAGASPPAMDSSSGGQAGAASCGSSLDAQFQQAMASLQKNYDTLIQQLKSVAACAATAAATAGVSADQQKLIDQQQKVLEQEIGELEKQEQQELDEVAKERQLALKDPNTCQAQAAALNSVISAEQQAQDSTQAMINAAQQMSGACTATPVATAKPVANGTGFSPPAAAVTGVPLATSVAPAGMTMSAASTPGSTIAPTSNAVPSNKQLASGSSPALKNLSIPLWGWADLHTHPMSNLAFGGKLFHGAPDVGSLMPAVQMPYDPQCRFDNRAISMDEALSDDAPTHGDVFQSKCGDSARNAFIQILEVANDAMHQPGHAIGAPTFGNWPRWNDITHQKMWVDWIRRAHDGGLRVMVALSHNNRLLGEAMGAGGPISGNKDDVSSSDLQVTEIIAFVGRHNDFMEVAKSSADLYRIVQAGKIAVVVGVEIDNFGNFIQKSGLTSAMVDAEIGRLYAQGVRYMIPIHLTDNVFGDTALYDPLFNAANFRENGRFWTVGCAGAGDLITYQAFNFPPQLNAFIPPGSPQPPRAPACPNGHINGRTPGGLTTLGQFALKAMMKRGIIIDIDHMSHHAVETALQMAWDATPAGYPMMSGHSGVRDGNEFGRENSRTPSQLEKIACLGGMFGVGTADAEAYQWAREYVTAYNAMTHAFAAGGTCPGRAPLGPGIVAFGTDTNSLVGTPRPTMVEYKSAPRYSNVYDPIPNNTDNPKLPVLPRSVTEARTWDYNMDGVAHYGMFAEFVRDVRMGPAQQGMTGKDLVDNHLLSNADYFYRMWQKAEAQAANVH